MKTKYILSFFTITFLTVSVFSQALHPSGTVNKSKDSIHTKGSNDNIVNLFNNNRGKLYNQNDTLFKESFNYENFDNEKWKKMKWKNQHGNGKIEFFKDNELKKNVLKVTRVNSNGESFILKDLSNILIDNREKKIKIISNIKFVNIAKGNESWETGKLCLKVISSDDTLFHQINELEGTSDGWNEFNANADGRGLNYYYNKNEPYEIIISKEAKKIILYLGLQNCSGTIYFSDVKIVELK
jgi:hypothetical protein